MGVRVDLSGGEWADLRDFDLITERDRRKVRLGMMRLSQEGRKVMGSGDAEAVADQLSADDAAVMFEVNDIIAAALVAEWSFKMAAGEALPISVEAVQALRGADYDKLQTAVAPAIGHFLGLDVGESADETSPTPPSNESG